MAIKLVIALAILCAPGHIFTDNSFSSKTELNNIVFHKGDVFVGAVDYLYRLNENLVQIKSKKVGPKNDSLRCSSRDEICKYKILTHNTNTLLLVYTHGNKSDLLSCGSLFQGICQLRNIKSLNVTVDSPRHVAANDGTSSTVAFISKGPVSGDGAIDILNVAVTHSKRIEGMSLPAVTIRRMHHLSMKKFLSVYRNSIKVADDSFIIDYKSGFSSHGFSYFTTVQPTAVGADTYASNILRYCQQDSSMSTYTEIPISCRDSTGVKYNVLIDGFVLRATDKLATIFNVASGAEMYIGIFSKSASRGKNQTEQNAVCVFSLTDINKAFEANIRRCILYGEPADGGLPWVKSSSTAGCQVIP